jgi:NTE family protein
MRGIVAALLAGVALCACARYPENPPLVRWEPGRERIPPAPHRRSDVLVIVAFSGGGTRAAAFGYGVLEALRDTRVAIGGREERLLDEVDFVSGVSGGSFPAAYYGLHGDGIFRDFEERFLRHDVQGDLIRSLLNPVNWVRLTSPFLNRSDLATEYYDRRVFDGATFADLEKGPGVEVVINATDMVRGSRFSFRQVELDYLCADLDPIPLARAVAASAAFPGPLAPVLLRSYAGTCGFVPPAWIEEALTHRGDSRRRLRQAQILQSYLDSGDRYVYLLDGGISDNLGVRFSFERAVEEGGFREVLERGGLAGTRQIVMIVVNAETERELRAGEEGLLTTGIRTVLGAVSGIQIRSFNFETLELVRSSFSDWARDLSRRSGEEVEFRLVDLSFDGLADPAERLFLRNLPTSFRLDDEAVDRLRAAARALLRDSPVMQEAIARISALPAEAAAPAPPAQPEPGAR